MFRQRCRFQRVIEFSVQCEPPALDILPRYVAAANGQKPIAILVNPERDETVSQDYDTREQQPNQMHHVFPAYLTVISKILFQLLELRQHICIVGAMDVLREKDLP
jgi:hypothetical protein